MNPNTQAKILLISHEPPPGKGASARILYRLFNLFQNDSYIVLTTPFHIKFPSDFSLKLKLPCKYYYSVGFYPGTHYTKWIAIKEWLLVPLMIIKCLNTIRKENVNKILVHPITGTFLLTAYLAHKITKIPLYLYMFDLFEENKMIGLRRVLAGPIERLAMLSSSNIFVMSEGLQEHYLKKYNRRTVLLPHPIDLKDNVVRQKKKIVKSEAKYKILLTAGMIYGGHIDAIINLIRAIREMPDMEFHVYTRNTEEYLKRYGINGCNVVYCGYEDSENISIIQKKADILFLPMAFNSPNYKEIIKTASPGKLPEYLVSGTPILVHAPPYAYISWYARKYGWGLMVDKPDPELLKEAILKLISDKKLQQDLIKNAQKTALLHDQNRVFGIFKKGLGISLQTDRIKRYEIN